MEGMTHIDGDVPKCMYNKNKDVELKAKKIEKTRGEGGGRQRYRHVEGDVPTCMRNNAEANEAISKENEKSSTNRAKCDGGSKKTKNVESESKGTSSSSTDANKTTSETKSEKYITVITRQKNVRSLNSRWDAILISQTWRASNAEIWET